MGETVFFVHIVYLKPEQNISKCNIVLIDDKTVIIIQYSGV